MSTSAPTIPTTLETSPGPLRAAVIEALGTLLALAYRLSRRTIGGVAHLLAAAAVLILGLLSTKIRDALIPWPQTARMPVLHHRWLVASPARWAAP